MHLIKTSLLFVAILIKCSLLVKNYLLVYTLKYLFISALHLLALQNSNATTNTEILFDELIETLETYLGGQPYPNPAVNPILQDLDFHQWLQDERPNYKVDLKRLCSLEHKKYGNVIHILTYLDYRISLNYIASNTKTLDEISQNNGKNALNLPSPRSGPFLGHTALGIAVRKDNFLLVTPLIYFGADPLQYEKVRADPNILWSHNVTQTLLHTAAQYNANHAANILLSAITKKYGYSETELKNFIEQKNTDGQTALFYAVQRKHYNSVGWLLSLKANPNAIKEITNAINTTYSESALQAAVTQRAPVDIINSLIMYKADVNYINPCTGLSILDCACKANYTEALPTLVENGAFCRHKKNIAAWGILHTLVRGSNESLEILKRIISPKKTELEDFIDQKDTDGETALARALKLKNYNAADWLLYLGANPNQHASGRSLLQIAVMKKAPIHILNSLINNKADVNYIHRVKRFTCLDAACDQNYFQAIPLLLQNGARCSPREKLAAWPPLDTLVSSLNKQNLEILKRIIILYAPFNTETPEKDLATLMYKELHKGNTQAAELLLEEYPQLARIPDQDGRLPLHTIATFRDGHKLWESIRESNLLRDIIIHLQKDSKSNPYALHPLLDPLGNTPLHTAVGHKNKVATELIAKAAPWMIGEENKKGDTPLHVAAGIEGDHALPLVEVLLQALTDGSSGTPVNQTQEQTLEFETPVEAIGDYWGLSLLNLFGNFHYCNSEL